MRVDTDERIIGGRCFVDKGEWCAAPEWTAGRQRMQEVRTVSPAAALLELGDGLADLGVTGVWRQHATTGARRSTCRGPLRDWLVTRTRQAPARPAKPTAGCVVASVNARCAARRATAPIRQR